MDPETRVTIWCSSLLPREIDADDVGAVLAPFLRRGFGHVILRFLMLLAELGGCVRLEGEGELDGWIVELGDRSERHVEGRGDTAERQTNGESVFLHLEVPEAVLDDDGHLVGEFLDQVLRNRDPGKPGLEGDVEMVSARQ